jgi:hypothetical protein
MVDTDEVGDHAFLGPIVTVQTAVGVSLLLYCAAGGGFRDAHRDKPRAGGKLGIDVSSIPLEVCRDMGQ